MGHGHSRTSRTPRAVLEGQVGQSMKQRYLASDRIDSLGGLPGGKIDLSWALTNEGQVHTMVSGKAVCSWEMG